MSKQKVVSLPSKCPRSKRQLSTKAARSIAHRARRGVEKAVLRRDLEQAKKLLKEVEKLKKSVKEILSILKGV